MSDWEQEFRKYFTKRLKSSGIEISSDQIKRVEVNTDLDLTLFELKDLAIVYAFAITREDFAQAKEISNEIASRNAEVRVEIDDKTKTGVINIYVQPVMDIPYVDVKMKVVNGDLMIDFDKENFG